MKEEKRPTLKIEINPPVFKFSPDRARTYACIGYVLSELASLEYDLDDFIFTMLEKDEELALKLAKTFPATFEEKIDFLIDAAIALPKLRSCGDGVGLFDLNTIAYGLEETLAFRNVFIHSRVGLIEMEGESFRCRIDKFTRVKGKRGRFRRERYVYSSGYLERVVDHAKYFKSLLWRLKASLNGEDVAAQADRVRRGNADFRELVRLMEEAGYDVNDAA